MKNKVKIFVFTDSSYGDTNIDFNEKEKAEIVKSSKKFPESVNEAVVIIQIDSIESKHLARCIDRDYENKGNVFFILESDKGLLASTVAKLGFSNIFVFPQEKQKFDLLLNETAENIFSAINISSSELKKSESEDVFAVFIGSSKVIESIIASAKKVALNPDVNILITGETGTGKGILAELIHKYSGNGYTPFVDVVCTAIPDNLLESELFGHEKGAFTDAKNRKLGLFEMAEGGTIFLDEIGDLDLNLQAKLLRAIEKKVIRRVGGTRDIKINARIISATNQDLEELTETKRFRKDLYYRLNVVTLNLPPLNKRGNDVIELTEYFVNMYNDRYDRDVTKMEDGLENILRNYEWPGNVRELSNTIERGVVLADDSTLKIKNLYNVGELDINLLSAKQPQPQGENEIRLSFDYTATKLSDVIRNYVMKVLEIMNGNKSKTAKILNISRPRLERIITSGE